MRSLGGPVAIVPLDATVHRRDLFTCGEPGLDAYLRTQASQDVRRRASAVFVAVSNPEPATILGYYTLAQASVALDSLPLAIRKKLPLYPSVPATLLGRLAVSVSAQGQGLGARLLGDAVRRALSVAPEVASSGVVVQPLDDSAAAFYARFGFGAIGTTPRLMFLPMATIGQAMDAI